MNPVPRILVMGAGGIGGIVAATLTEVGAAVTAVSTNAQIRAAVDRAGYRVIEQGEERVVRGWVSPAPEGKYDLCVLAVQPPNVEEAARTALAHLADDARVVVLQNGLCEERVGAIVNAPALRTASTSDAPALGVGGERVVGAVVTWGAAMPEAGVYEKTAAGGFAIGRLDGVIDDDLRAIAELLEAVGPTTITTNLRGARWSKLALNCAVSALGTIAGERLGPLVRVRRYRRLALEAMTEAVDVARAEGVALEKVAGTLDLAWIALTETDRASRGSASLTAKHALLLAVGLRYRRMRSSMLAAIERGRTPSIDYLNGEVVTRGKARAIATPVNERIVAAVWDIAKGRAKSSRELLDRVCEPE